MAGLSQAHMHRYAYTHDLYDTHIMILFNLFQSTHARNPMCGVRDVEIGHMSCLEVTTWESVTRQYPEPRASATLMQPKALSVRQSKCF